MESNQFCIKKGVARMPGPITVTNSFFTSLPERTPRSHRYPKIGQAEVDGELNAHVGYPARIQCGHKSERNACSAMRDAP